MVETEQREKEMEKQIQNNTQEDDINYDQEIQVTVVITPKNNGSSGSRQRDHLVHIPQL